MGKEVMKSERADVETFVLGTGCRRFEDGWTADGSVNLAVMDHQESPIPFLGPGCSKLCRSTLLPGSITTSIQP